MKQQLFSDEMHREGMRAAGRFNAQVMDFIRPYVTEGITTDELDRLVHKFTLDHQHIPACLGYQGYPKSICTSINDVVCHGIPDGTRLKNGDIVNIDVTTIVNGWHGDQSETFFIGDVSDTARQLAQAAFDALFVAIREIRPNDRVVRIGRAIYRLAKSRGFEVVRGYQGHGIGREFHQDPGIPHVPLRSSAREIIRPGMCFTIEPMLNLGTWRTARDPHDGWTVRTADGSLSAQFEHTILMTENGPEILTLTKDGPREGQLL